MLDPENIGKEAVVRVSNWIRGIWEMRRRTSPVQQWVDSLPSPSKTSTKIGSIIRQHSVSIDSEPTSVPECIVEQVLSEKENYISHSNMTVSTPIAVPNSPAATYSNVSRLVRDPSFQSDSSHCSSVESLLELRRADPEAVLLSLGFGGCSNSPRDTGPLSRIPKRFLQPSRLKGIAINDFVKHQQETNESLDSTSLGYRGLTGSPYIAPSEIVQKIMQRLREHEYHEFDAYATYNNNTEPDLLPQQQEGKLSVLSPDNRQFLERPRSKSPDMRNKRMIIGQKSFAFGRDGDLIEISSSSSQPTSQKSSMFEYLSDTNTVHQMGPTAHADEEIVKNSDGEYSTGRSKQSLVDLNTRSGENRDSTETIIFSTASNFNANNNYVYNNDTNENASEFQSLSDNNDITDELVQSYNSSLRRASEGTCERSSKTSQLEQEEGRRFSDGVMHPMMKSEALAEASAPSSTRRRSLKRQAKIRDMDSLEDISFAVDVDNDADESKKSTSPALMLENRCVHCGEVERSHKEIEEEASVSCCYKRTSQHCWTEMEKVLQKNKKLEDVVAKSRREMAEIRDMLSNVLSVRMEPGF